MAEEKVIWSNVGYVDEQEFLLVSKFQSLSLNDQSATSFEDLNLTPALVKNLHREMRFEKPSKIQAICLPMIMTPPHRNLVAQAHNGSGKTTCFVLGMLSRVDPMLRGPQALCICPTRELANQTMEVLQKMGKFTGITAQLAVATGGTLATRLPPVSAHVVIGTLGTLQTWMAIEKLGLSHLKILVFDEADHMLATDGFRDDSIDIMNYIGSVNPNFQVILFSTTLSESVKDFIAKTITDPNQLFARREDLALESVKQYKVVCPNEKSKILMVKDEIMELGDIQQVIIFVRTKFSARKLHRALEDMQYDVTNVHGYMSEADRDKIVKEFNDGLTQVLIATDLFARGFDQKRVNLVVNFNLPTKYPTGEPDYELYLHRVGRTGRFGSRGMVFNMLLNDGEKDLMEKIEKHFELKVKEINPWNSSAEYKVAFKEADMLS